LRKAVWFLQESKQPSWRVALAIVVGRVDEFSIDDVFGIPMLNRA
jgi:hypothetical protein